MRSGIGNDPTDPLYVSVTGGGGGGTGGGAVTIANGADVAQGNTNDAAYTDRTGAAAGTEVAILKGLFTGIVGNVATATADSGNPVKIGGVYNTSFPVLTAGQRGDLQVNPTGALNVAPVLQSTAADGGNNANYGVLVRRDSNSGVALGVFPSVFNGTTWDRVRGDTNGAWSVLTGSAAAAVGIAPTVASAAFSLVVKASAGNFYGGSIVAGATAGFLIAYNAAAAPAAGATLTAAQVLGVVAVAANGSAALGEYTVPDRFSTGIVLLFSTSTTTYTQPTNAAAFLRGRAM